MLWALAGCSQPEPLSAEAFDALTAAYRDQSGATSCASTCGGVLEGASWTAAAGWNATGEAAPVSGQVLTLNGMSTFVRPVESFRGQFSLACSVLPQAAVGQLRIALTSDDGAQSVALVFELGEEGAKLATTADGVAALSPKMRLATGGAPSLIQLEFDCGQASARLGGQLAAAALRTDVEFSRMTIAAELSAGAVSVSNLTFSTTCP